VRDLKKAEASNAPIISHEALLTLQYVFAFFPVPRKEDVDQGCDLFMLD
jgi:hypothetical protein